MEDAGFSDDARIGGTTGSIDVLGAYHLVCPIGSGGMASVWLAVDSRTGRFVAVKRMRPGAAQDRELRRAFSDEAALGIRLQHPNVIETIELGATLDEDGGEPYLVLELLRGRTAVEIIEASRASGQPVPIGVAMSIIRDIARGLHHAHEHLDVDGLPLKIVHRDVTPRNVLVCANGVAKIIDFGIAKAARQSHKTESGAIKGTLGYVAPEQIHGHAPDARADIFALGLIMYELLTGRQPLRGDNDADTLYRILEQKMPAPEQLRPGLSPAIGAIVMRALKRDRDRRLPSAGAVDEALTACAAQEGIVLDDDATREYVASLFPDDVRKWDERIEMAKHTYVRVRSNTTAPQGTPSLTTGSTWRKRRALVRVAFAAGALSLTAFAAASTRYLLDRHDAPALVERAIAPLAPRASAPTYELPAAPEIVPQQPRPAKHAAKRKSRCAVYVTIAHGPTTICTDEPRHKSSRR